MVDISEEEIKKRYFEGFANLNTYFRCFEHVDIFDTSAYSREPQYILSIENGITTTKKVLPQYLIRLIPEIWGSLK
jgi:predicted ABC-type ATPase